MARRPAVLCKFLKNKAIGAIKPLADTMNWIISFVDNLKGDYDEDPGNGCIEVDRSDTEHPFIRFHAENIGEPLDVVTGVFYDPNTHKQTYTTRKVRAIIDEDDSGFDEEHEVFEAVPHDAQQADE